MFKVIVRNPETNEIEITNKFDTQSRANRWVMDEEIRLSHYNYTFEIVEEIDQEQFKTDLIKLATLTNFIPEMIRLNENPAQVKEYLKIETDKFVNEYNVNDLNIISEMAEQLNRKETPSNIYELFMFNGYNHLDMSEEEESKLFKNLTNNTNVLKFDNYYFMTNETLVNYPELAGKVEPFSEFLKVKFEGQFQEMVLINDIYLNVHDDYVLDQIIVVSENLEGFYDQFILNPAESLEYLYNLSLSNVIGMELDSLIKGEYNLVDSVGEDLRPLDNVEYIYNGELITSKIYSLVGSYDESFALVPTPEDDDLMEIPCNNLIKVS